MESYLGPLLPLFERERLTGRAVVLGVLLHTAGSTYRKPGALILIAGNGEYAGLISGGCLEGDLGQHARGVLASGTPQIVSYDMRSDDDLLWGLGLGCAGAMRIMLLRVGPQEHWQPLAFLAQALERRTATAVGVITESPAAHPPVGSIVVPISAAGTPGTARALSEVPAVQAALNEAAATSRIDWAFAGVPDLRIFVLPLALPPCLLVLGAGPDALPVVEFAVRVGFRVTVADHRSAYARPEHFPQAERVVLTVPGELPRTCALEAFTAAVVMSHHLPSDLAYLRVLAESSIRYVGLLGPASRRERLLQDLGPLAAPLRPRLRAPVGLPLGGRSPEAIALAIVAELQAFVHGKEGERILLTQSLRIYS